MAERAPAAGDLTAEHLQAVIDSAPAAPPETAGSVQPDGSILLGKVPDLPAPEAIAQEGSGGGLGAILPSQMRQVGPTGASEGPPPESTWLEWLATPQGALTVLGCVLFAWLVLAIARKAWRAP